MVASLCRAPIRPDRERRAIASRAWALSPARGSRLLALARRAPADVTAGVVLAEIDAVRKVAIAGCLIAIGRDLIAVGIGLVSLTARLIRVGERLVAVGERLVGVGERLVGVGERLVAVGERLVAGVGERLLVGRAPPRRGC